MVKTFRAPLGTTSVPVFVHVGAYAAMEPAAGKDVRMAVTLETNYEAVTPNDDEGLMSPIFAVISTNFPTLPPPPINQSVKAFYAKTWGENEGLLEELSRQGIVRVLPGTEFQVNQFGSKAVMCDLVLKGDEVVVDPVPQLKTAFAA